MRDAAVRPAVQRTATAAHAGPRRAEEREHLLSENAQIPVARQGVRAAALARVHRPETAKDRAIVPSLSDPEGPAQVTQVEHVQTARARRDAVVAALAFVLLREVAEAISIVLVPQKAVLFPAAAVDVLMVAAQQDAATAGLAHAPAAADADPTIPRAVAVVQVAERVVDLVAEVADRDVQERVVPAVQAIALRAVAHPPAEADHAWLTVEKIV